MTIYNLKLYIGRDDVLYDAETELYYMHARYYDPEAGRFIMKDPVEGSLGNPITQNSYIYCANDPVNKIDPAGTTPQNTGLPPRYENEPQAVKWAGSNRTAFCLPNDPNYMENEAYHTFTIWDLYPNNGCMSGGNIIWLSLPGIASAMDTFDSCDRFFDRGKVTMGEYVITYGWDLDGNPYVKVKPKKDGNGNKETAEAIEKGMNDALKDLYNEKYFNFNSLGSLVNDVASFMGSGGWGELANVNKAFKDPYNAFYHSTVGAAIASEMGSIEIFGKKWSETELSKKEFSKSGRNWTEKDLKILIGTAVSFENKNWNTQLGFYYSTDVWGQTTLGLVDVANLIFSTMRWESSFNPEAINYGSNDVGLMQLHKDRKPGENEEDYRTRMEEEG